jgi:fumarate reductase flavoprotein subunit
VCAAGATALGAAGAAAVSSLAGGSCGTTTAVAQEASSGQGTAALSAQPLQLATESDVEGDAGVLEQYRQAAEQQITQEQLDKIGMPHPYSAVSYEPIPGTDPIAPTEPPAKWDYEAEVIVVGLGGGGIAATMMCAESGISVIGIDKNQEAGGCTQESGGFPCYGGMRSQDAAGISMCGLPYTAEAMTRLILSSNYKMDVPLARRYFDIQPKLMNWLEDEGVEWEMVYDHGAMAPFVYSWKGAVRGGFYPRATKLVTDFISAKAQQLGADYHLEQQVTSLVMDGDTVVGVRARAIDGTETTYHATGAVILTAGGFASNPRMLQKYCPTAYRAAASSKLPPCDTGEVIRMGWGAGADIIGYDTWGGFDGGIDAYSEGLGTFSHYLYSGDNQLSRQPWLSFDKTGHRHVYLPFVIDPDYAADPVTYPALFQSGGSMKQPEIQAVLADGREVVVFDSHYEEYIDGFHQGGCRKPITPEMVAAPETSPNAPVIDRLPEWLGPHDWRDGVKKSLDKGIIKQADTLEELADLVGYDRDIFVNTVNHWNDLCAQGSDPEFWYKPEFLKPIVDPPFYAIKIGVQMGQTHCGLLFNDRFEVLDKHGKHIPGLYCGTHTGGNTYGFGAGNGGSWIGGYGAAETVIEQLRGTDALYRYEDAVAPSTEVVAQTSASEDDAGATDASGESQG